MKAARLNITTPVLAKLLGLPPEASIVSVFQDPNDLAHGTVSLIVHGVGCEMIEGSAVKTMGIEELEVK